MLNNGRCLRCAGVVMSDTGRGSLLPMRTTPSVGVNNVLRQNFSPAALARSRLQRLAANLVAAFFAFATIVHQFLTRNYLQNQSESRLLLLWNVSCIFTAVQLALTCWLLFVIAPRIQTLCELAAWMFYGIGFIFSFLIGTVLCYASLLVILIVAVIASFCIVCNHDYRFTERCCKWLIRLWSCSGMIYFAIFLCTVAGGLVIKCVTVILYWLTVVAGVLLPVLLQLIVICLVVGGVMLSVLSVLATKHQSGSSRLDTDYGDLLRFDDYSETVVMTAEISDRQPNQPSVIQRRISVCLTYDHCLCHCTAN